MKKVLLKITDAQIYMAVGTPTDLINKNDHVECTIYSDGTYRYVSERKTGEISRWKLDELNMIVLWSRSGSIKRRWLEVEEDDCEELKSWTWDANRHFAQLLADAIVETALLT